MRWLRVLPFVLLPASALTGSTQTAKKAAAVLGSVTGSVTCADTNAPARFAVVTLEPVPEEKGATARKSESEGQMNATATTDLEGRFEMDKVAAGRYYVLADMRGYLNPLARFDPQQLKAMSEETRKELAQVAPIVTVEAGQAAAVALRLEHAAEVSGTVLYDDGSPAVGLAVQLMRKDKDGKLIQVSTELLEGLRGMSGSRTETDDYGRYRMMGVPKGEYVVRASLPTETVSVNGLLNGSVSVNTTTEEGGELRVYSGNVFREKSAATVKVGESDQSGGVDITIPLAGLHSVQGILTAKRDGHALNSGRVDLLYADDASWSRTVHVSDDGSFELRFVPEGQYILRAVSGQDVETVELHPYAQMTVRQSNQIREYGKAEMPLVVQGEVTGLELALPDTNAAPKVARQIYETGRN